MTTSRLKRDPRRRRPGYPSIKSLPRGMAGDVERPECGRCEGLPIIDPVTLKRMPGAVANGTYVFHRELPIRGRSRYDPQVEDAKRGRRQ